MELTGTDPNSEVILLAIALVVVAAGGVYWMARREGGKRAFVMTAGFLLVVSGTVFVQFAWFPLLLAGGVILPVMASIALGLWFVHLMRRRSE